MKTLLRILSLALLWPLLASAQSGASTIERVTVYLDRAEVVRLVNVQVAAGEGRLQLAELPIDAHPDWLRISVRQGEGLVLGGVELRPLRGAERVEPRARELEARISERELARQALTNRIEARNLQLKLLDAVAAGGEGAGTAADRLRSLEAIGGHAEELLGARLALETERAGIDRELERLRRELADLGQARRDTREVTVDYRSERAGSAQLELRYVVSSAGWEPVYEWRLQAEAGRLELIQQAVIRQNTGEDWADVELRVALGQPAAGGQLPSLYPWYIDVFQPRREAPVMESMAMDRALAAPAPPAMATLEGSEMAAEFRIPGRGSVSGDNTQRRFALARYDLEARISARTAPRRQARAWLFAEAEYSGEAWLPPGRVSLFQDGGLIGQTRFGGLAPGAALEASFGVADRIEVQHRMLRDTRGSDGVLRRQNRLEREFEISITNRYGRPLEVLVLDQLPLPRDERIQVEPTSGSRSPDVRDFNDQPGVVAWRDELAAGQSRSFRFGYRATFPRDIESLSGW